MISNKITPALLTVETYLLNDFETYFKSYFVVMENSGLVFPNFQ